MLTKTERELDLENLKQLQEDGKIEQGVNIEHVADQLPVWRESDYWKDKVLLARYGRGSDLDKLAVDPDWNTRAAVAKRGRPKTTCSTLLSTGKRNTTGTQKRSLAVTALGMARRNLRPLTSTNLLTILQAN